MERKRLGISLRQHVKNIDIRQRRKITDNIEQTANLKWQWVGHVSRQSAEKWTLRTVHWRPRESRRRIGRPPKRWLDDIKNILEDNGFLLAHNRC